MFRHFQYSFCISVLTVALIFSSCSKDEVNEDSPEKDGTTENSPEIENIPRAKAKKLYEDHYVASKTVSSDDEWNGDLGNCKAGSVSANIMSKIFQRAHYFRLAVGLNNTLTENLKQSEKAQEAALMMRSNNKLDHFPPSSWSCFTQGGSEAAGKSNLVLRSKNAEAVDLYISEPGSSNGAVGHRRWMLWPRLSSMGVGNTDFSNALWVVGNSGAAPSDEPEFVSWPPADYVPHNLVYPRWSFSKKGADFSETKVSMTDETGSSVSITMEVKGPSFGDPTIVWVPKDVKNSVTEDTSYTVKLTDVNINGELKDFEYNVILFNPNN